MNVELCKGRGLPFLAVELYINLTLHLNSSEDNSIIQMLH